MDYVMFFLVDVLITLLPAVVFFIGAYFIFRKKNKPIEIKEKEKDKAKRFKYYFDELSKDKEYKEVLGGRLSRFLCDPSGMIVVFFTLFFGGSLLFTELSSKINFPFAIFMLPLFIIYVVLMVKTLKKTKKLEKMYKQIVIEKAIKEFYPNYKYEADNGIKESEYIFKKFEIYDEYVSDDKLEFKLSTGQTVRMSNVKTTREETDSDGNRTTVVIFNGVCGYVTLPLKNKYNNFLVGRVGRKSNVTLDDDEFNNKYSVYCENEVIAYKFLTPDIMLKLIDLANAGDKFEFCLTEDNKLYFRYYSGDLFPLQVREKKVIESLIVCCRTIDKCETVINKAAEYVIDKDS